MRHRRLLIGCITVAALAVIGCAPASVSLKHASMNPQYEGQRFAKLLVVGLAETTYRVPFEDTFVQELKARGVEAVASHWSVGDLGALADQEQVDEVVRETGVDGVLTVRAEGFREADSRAWEVAYSATFWLVDDWDARRDMRRAIAFGSAVDHEDAASYGVEVEMWEASTSQSLWVAKTDTYDPGELREVVSKFADVVVDELRRVGLI